MVLRAALLAFWALFGAAGHAQSPSNDPYVLEVGDRIAVSVLEDPALNQSLLIRPDGRVTMPIAGEIEAAGRTPLAVQDTIRRALTASFLVPPTVTVTVVGLGASPTPPVIYVLGEVRSPGPIRNELPLDILQALALAGGPGPFAATTRIQIRRKENGRDTMRLFNYDHVVEGLLPITSVPLADGDVIVVPQRRLFE